MAEWTRPNGLVIERVRVPLGVIGIIYESRPNVTADAGALCLKSGNAAILRGGSESFYSSHAIHDCLVTALEATGLPGTAIQMIPTTDREAVGYLLSGMARYVDVVVPRGGKNLIARVQSLAAAHGLLSSTSWRPMPPNGFQSWPTGCRGEAHIRRRN